MKIKIIIENVLAFVARLCSKPFSAISNSEGQSIVPFWKRRRVNDEDLDDSISSKQVPWRLLIPIFVMLGLGMTVWSGIYLVTSAYENWEGQLKLGSEQKVATVGANWQKLEGYMASFSNLYIASPEKVSAKEFSVISEKVIDEFPSMKTLAYLPNHVQQSAYVYPAEFIQSWKIFDS